MDANRTAILAEAKPTLGALAPTRLVSCSRRPLTDFPLHRDRKFPTMTAPPSPKPANPPAEPPLTRISDELERLRASVNKLTRAQNALLFNVKALTDHVHSLSDMVLRMSKTMRPGAAEDEARNQLH
jgi:hypothetical protein